MALKKSAAAGRKPNLPRHEFQEPFRRLLSLGEGDHDEIYEAIAASIRRTNASDGARTLLKMVQDDSWYEYDIVDRHGGIRKDPRSETRIHALRVLSQLGPAAEIGIRPLLLLMNSEDDYLREEIPFYFTAMGVPAFAPLCAVLTDSNSDIEMRVGAGEAIGEIGQQHQDLRAECIGVIESVLKDEDTDPELAGELVVNLLDLGAKESYPLIEKAYREDRVEDIMVTLANVQEHFDLPITAPKPRRNVIAPEQSRTLSMDEVELEPVDETAEIDTIRTEESQAPGSETKQPFVADQKIGRNDPCNCGSGKKYKKCCGINA